MLTTFSSHRITRLAQAAFFTFSLLGIGTAVSAQEPAATPRPVTSRSATDAVAVATGSDGVLRFDVAEDGTHFVWDPDQTFDDGMPAYGASFITRGYLYPAGTLTASTGVNADGLPEFPDQVLGEWVCRGWFAGEGMRTTTGVMVITTQLFTFGDVPGEAMVVSDGYELADVGVEIARAITGGTGPFIGAAGESRQTLLGLNATEGVNLQFALNLDSSRP